MKTLNRYIVSIIGIVLLFAAMPAFSQSPTTTMNFIEMREPRVAIQTQAALDAKSPSNDSVMTTIKYIDGMGRPIQTVQYQASPSDRDVVMPQSYDTYGRESIKYLPYATANAATSNGAFKTDALTTGAGVYQFYNPSNITVTTPTQQTNGVVVTAYPYSVAGYELSPLNRVVEQGAPGEHFQLTPGTGDGNSSNHTSKVIYSSNDQVAFVNTTLTNNPGNHEVAQYTATINNDQSRTLGRVNNTALYAAGLLTIAITKDENWKPGNGCIGTTEIYKNKEGQIILRRTYHTIVSGGITQIEQLSTYYVYDDFGNLCFVLPPGTQPDNTIAISSANLDGYCYQYRYDQRNRVIQKKLPGKGWEFLVYNALDQVTFRQDANQRNKTPQVWTYYHYDTQGRQVISGIWSSGGITGNAADSNVDAPSTVLQQWLVAWQASQTTMWSIRDNTTLTGYAAVNPVGNEQTVNYYDNYNIPGLPASYDQHTNTAYTTRTNGLPTATKTYVLNTTDPLWTVNYYNELGLPIRIFKQHYLGGTSALSTNNYDDLTITYNFNLQPLKVTKKHYDNVSSVATLVLTSIDAYSYDQMGRAINHFNQLQNHANTPQATVLVAQNSYNAIGQLMIKKLNAKSPYTSFLQTVDYRYTPRGWLSSINNASLNMTDATTNSTTGNADQFGEELSYDYTSTGIAQYNGNISTVKWKTGDFPASSGVPAQVSQQYDYRYDPLNQLINAVSSSAGVKNGYFNENIAYNRMGNISSLGRYDHGLIDSLTYTDLYYQVQKITNTAAAQTCPACFVDGVNLSQEYVYDINGNMTQDKNKGISSITYNPLNLPQTITKSNGNTIVYIYDAAGTKLRKVTTVGSNVTTTEYINGIEYDNGVLAFLQNEQGRARLSGTTYNYEYDLKDHLGNTRATIKDDGTGLPQVLQMESYYPFGATIASLEPVIPSPKNHYLYNDKEIQDETNLYDYGARLYDPVMGRWTSIDPLAEISRRFSPYNYVQNNSIRNIDPDGMWTQTTTDDGYQESSTDDPNEIRAFAGSIQGQEDNGKLLEQMNDPDAVDYSIDLSKINTTNANQAGTRPSDQWFLSHGWAESGAPWYGNFLGPGPDGNPYKLIGPDKQYLKPIDMLDAAAQQHDYWYDKAKVGGIHGALFEDKVYEADLQLAYAANRIIDMSINNQNDTITGMPISEMELSWAYRVTAAFTQLGNIKKFGMWLTGK